MKLFVAIISCQSNFNEVRNNTINNVKLEIQFREE